MNNRALAISSLLGGLAIAVLSNIPFVNLANCFFCMWVWLGGAFAVWYYDRSEGTITQGQGAIVGVLSGLIAAAISTAIGLLFGLAGAGLAALAGPQMQTAEEFMGSTVASLLFTGGASLIGFLFSAVFYSIFGALGGLLGAMLLERRKTKA